LINIGSSVGGGDQTARLGVSQPTTTAAAAAAAGAVHTRGNLFSPRRPPGIRRYQNHGKQQLPQLRITVN